MRDVFIIAILACLLTVVVVQTNADEIKIKSDTVQFDAEDEPCGSSCHLCLDGFCIGHSIRDKRFDKVEWILPKDLYGKTNCTGVGCRPEIAFRGYSNEDQEKLADALSWQWQSGGNYNIVTKGNLEIFRQYKYECNLSARGGLGGERRFLGVYRSAPSQYVTVVGLRLVDGGLRIYRTARLYPYHNQNELISLANELRAQYGGLILFYNYLSSNAYPDVIKQNKDGWFGRSTMFNPVDLSDNAAELVLIDPNTRILLQPSSFPESGEIKQLPVEISQQCNRAPRIQ